MAEIFQTQAKDVVIRLNNYDAVNAIRNFDWSGEFNQEQIEELGNKNIVAYTNMPELTGSFEVTATGATVAMLRRMITKTNGSGDFLGYLAGFETTETNYANNVGTIRGIDLERAAFDIVEAKKANEIFHEATVLPRVQLSSLSFSADASGMASETYSFQGDLIRLYETPRHDVVCVPAKYVDSDSVIAPDHYTIKLAASATGSDWAIRAIQIGETLHPASVVATVTPGVSPVGDTINFNAGTTVTIDQRVSVILYRKTPGAFPTISYPTSARFVKADQIDIYLIPTSGTILSSVADGSILTHALFTDANRVLRVQSASMNIDLRREALRQIAKTDKGNSIYYRAATYPLACTADLSLLETDWALWAKLCGSVDLTSEVNGFLDFSEFEGRKWQLAWRYYYQGTPIQAMALCDAEVAGPGHRVGTGSRAEVSYSFTGSDWVVEGAAV
jgi:hypothetical protein